MTVMRSHVEDELASQPDCWARAADAAPGYADVLPSAGERVAVIGCGTSLHIAAAYAAAREEAGAGLTDAFPASEARLDRGYDAILALSRSGTTTEVIDSLSAAPAGSRRITITADARAPLSEYTNEQIVLDYADEHAVVQTRFATSSLALLLTSLRIDISPAVEQARALLDEKVDMTLVDRPHYVFLGRGWTVGVAAEAALKVREAAAAWSETYPAMEYRHGPLSAATERSVIWFMGEPPAGLVADISISGATVVADPLEPLADLVRAQRVAVETARARGLDPDRPRYLSRSVVLEPGRH
jgi:fructoselysine-6-P-deglycase FrlB-like protein